MPKNGAAIAEWVIPRQYLKTKSGLRGETTRSMSGKTAPGIKAIVAALPTFYI